MFWYFCCCLGSGIGSLFSIIGIFWMLDNAGKILKIAGIIILGIVGLYLLYVFLSSIVYAIEAKIKEKKDLIGKVIKDMLCGATRLTY